MYNPFIPHQPRRNHICGLYYLIPCNGYLQKNYLPQVELQAHATILSTTSRTVLTQTFINPSTEKGIKEVRYTFPLYDGVSVVGFTCHVGDRTIVGEVKEKEKAKAVFKEAIERGETAGLLEQLPDAADVFTTTVGNIPPGARVIIKITYLGELKHDMEVDGIRYTIPNIICPRYGSYPGALRRTTATDALGSKISITIDAEMPEGSFIQKIQSPSHPIAITMGTTTFAPNADPSMSKASATLTSGSAELDTDFVLQVVAKDTGVPKAVLETHPTIPNQRALMATLVPKFALPPEKPEVVFVCDRSGSMSGSRITLVIQALKVFLKSLPVGVKFNICSFGSHHSFLWNRSVTYSQQTLDEAVRHAETFSANYGGTEMLAPLKSTIENRYKDMPLEVMLLTDGQIWNEEALFGYLNKSVTESKAPIRIFSLGIGNGVSHALIEGVARAGNGFSQSVGEGEKMDTKVVRMLKGALSPHINDYTLEVKYQNDNATSEDTDDFEIVEKVADSLQVKLDIADEKSAGFQSKSIRAFFTSPLQKKPISLFDTSADPDKEDPPAYDETGEAKYAHLPKVPVPNILQAPQNIPSLFAFNRTSVYLLFGPDAPQATPKSVVLRGTSTHGPLELDIPVQVLGLPSETIHQLAAKKAIYELEQGRGWLPEAKTEAGKLIKNKFEGRFSDMVEREAVRLGVQFQVGGKWCSFVAVEANKKNRKEEDQEAPPEWEWLEDEAPAPEQDQFKQGKYSFDFDSSGEEDEDEDITVQGSTAAERLRNISRRLNQDIDSQNLHIQRCVSKSDTNDRVSVESSMRLRESKKKSKDSRPAPPGGLQLFGSAPPPPARASRKRMTQSSASSSSSAMPLSTAAVPQLARQSQQSQELNDTLRVMKENIGAVTERGERLDSLSDRSDNLSVSSKAFGRSAGHGGGGGLFGSAASLFGKKVSSPEGSPPLISATYNPDGNSFGPGVGIPPLHANAPHPSRFSSLATGSALPPPPPPSAGRAAFGSPAFGSMMVESRGGASSRRASSNRPKAEFASAPSAPATPVAKTPEDLLHHIISLQTFEGSWEWDDSLIATLVASLNLTQSLIAQEAATSSNKKHLATALVIAVFEERLASFKGSWELVVDKARGWLEDEMLESEDIMVKARKLVL